MQTLLILSDGKPGHLNQSRAFADLSGQQYTVLEVRFRNRLCKGLSFLLDKLAIYWPALFQLSGDSSGWTTVVSAGSETYYANRTLALRSGARSVAVMLPRGYRYSGFDLIIAQEHDSPPLRNHIRTLPINLCSVEPKNLFQPEQAEQYVGLVVGGPNKVFQMDPDRLRLQIEQIFELFPRHKIVIATSRRTPIDVEELASRFAFTETWLYSRDPANPIPDFLAHCDYVFITADSTSMISEAVSFGRSAVEIIPLQQSGPQSKFNTLVNNLERRGCLHLFDGTVGSCRLKIDLAAELKGVFG